MSLFCKIITSILSTKHYTVSVFTCRWKHRTTSIRQVAKPPFKISLNPISKETKQIAAKELRETPDVVAIGLKGLRELLRNDKSIYYETDDDFLKIFLRPCKYYPKSAYELMKRIAEFRAKHKDLFEGLVPEHEREAFMNYDTISVLTTKDHKGRRILVMNLGDKWEPSKVKIEQLLRMLYLIHLGAMLDPEVQVRGIVVIMDFNKAGLEQIINFTPEFAMKLMTFIQDAMPLRLKEVHIINNPMLFMIIWQILKPLLKEKLRERIHIHESNLPSFHKFIPPSHLPSNYGGDLSKINYTSKDWYPALEELIDHIKKWNFCGKR